MSTYGMAKLANVQFASELHRRYGTLIDTASLHPGGMIQTEIVTHWLFPFHFLIVILLHRCM
jgi:NAD(P)-dependent dehydrogenase (short-subunit alcohol dehydrogenase family)